MNIYGIGTDIVNINRIKTSIKKNKNAFAYKVDFTQKNLDLNETFDLILFFGVLHHMANHQENVMENIYTHLNGILYFL